MAFAMETITALADRGHELHIVVSKDTDPPFSFNHTNVRSIVTFRDMELPKGFRDIEFLRVSLTLANRNRYDLSIGISQFGVITAKCLNLRYGTPYLFYNDEITFGNERASIIGKIYGHAVKIFERKANRKALLTVTQDANRGILLSKVNKIHSDTLRYLPNSRSGKASLAQSQYIYERFGIPRDEKIVLWLGMVTPGDGSLELARSAEYWPSGYRMIFHFRTDKVTSYIEEIKSYHGKGKTFISTKAIPYEEVDLLAHSATVGLGIYADQGVNTRCIGSSSGKINMFFKGGIPCVVSDFEGLRWVEESGAGLCIRKIGDLFPCVEKIMHQYPTYRERAVEIFEKRLNFDKAFCAIAQEVEYRLAGM